MHVIFKIHSKTLKIILDFLHVKYAVHQSLDHTYCTLNDPLKFVFSSDHLLIFHLILICRAYNLKWSISLAFLQDFVLFFGFIYLLKT